MTGRRAGKLWSELSRKRAHPVARCGRQFHWRNVNENGVTPTIETRFRVRKRCEASAFHVAPTAGRGGPI